MSFNLGNFLRGAENAVANTVNNVVHGVENAGGQAVNAVTNTANNVVHQAAPAAQQATNYVNNTAHNVGHVITGAEMAVANPIAHVAQQAPHLASSALNTAGGMAKSAIMPVVNTVVSPVEAGIGLVTHNPAMVLDANARNPIAQAGTDFSNAGHDVQNGVNPTTNLIKGAGVTTNLVASALPLVGFGKNQAIKSVGGQILDSAAKNAALGGVVGGAQGAQTGDPSQILKGAATGAALGAGLGAGGEALAHAAPVVLQGAKAVNTNLNHINDNVPGVTDMKASQGATPGGQGFLAYKGAASGYDKLAAQGKPVVNFPDAPPAIEVSDKNMKVKDPGAQALASGQTVALQSVLDHPQMQKQYPGLFSEQGGANVKIGDAGGHRANFDPNQNLITVDPKVLGNTPEAQAKALQTDSGKYLLGHELSHVVDNVAGVRGTSPEAVKASLQSPEYNKAQNTLTAYQDGYNQLQQNLKDGHITQDQFNNDPFAQAYQKAQAVVAKGQPAQPIDVYRAYNNTPAERRANLIGSDRMNMSQKQIDKNPIGVQPVPSRLPGAEPGLGDQMAAMRKTPQPKGSDGKFVKGDFSSSTEDKNIDSLVKSGKAKVSQMTPDEYLRQAFEATDGKLGGTYDSWLASNRHDAEIHQKYAESMKKGDKFPTPYLDKANGSQDGRNRAIAAKLAGKKTIPVAVVPERTPAEEVAFLKAELSKATTPYMKHHLGKRLETAQSRVAQSTKDNPMASMKNPEEGKNSLQGGSEVPKPNLSSQGLGKDQAPNKFSRRVAVDPRANEGLTNSMLANGQHDILRNKDVLQKADSRIAKDENAALTFAKSGKGTEANATALRLLDKYLNEGKFNQADELVRAAEPRFTRAGQETQILAAYQKLTPTGAVRYATHLLDKAKEEFPKTKGMTPELAKKITAQAQKVQDATDETTRSLESQKLSKLVNNQIPRGKAKAFLDIWRTGLLTGPETVAKVGTSLAINTPVELAVRPLTAAIDRGVSTLVPDKTLKFLNRNNKDYAPGQRTVTFKPSDYKTFAGGHGRGVEALGTKLKTGLDMPGTGGFEKPMGKGYHQTPYEDAVYRVHGATFKPTFTGAYDMEMANQARIADLNAHLTGGKPVDLSSPQIKAQAQKYAENFANQQHTAAGEMTNKLQAFKVGPLPIGEWMAPFSHIPSAIGVKGLVDLTPIGTVRAGATLYKGFAKGTFDQRKFVEALGKSTLGGTAIVYAGNQLMASGRMTLQAPNDTNDKALWDLQGKSKNSIYIGGKVTNNADGTTSYSGGKWVTLNTFGPLGIALGLGGAFHQATQGGQSGTKAVTTAIASGAKLIADQPYFKGITGVGNVFTDPQRYATSYIQNSIASFIPALSQQIARGTDTVQRATPQTIGGSLAQAVPGLRETQPVQNDFFGNPLPGSNPNGTVLGGVLGSINPFYPSPSRNEGDQVTQELQRLYEAANASGGIFKSPSISAPNKDVGKSINGSNLSTQQLSDFIAQSGPVIKQALNNLIQNPQYQALDDAGKVRQIDKIVSAARTGEKVAMGANPKTLTATDRQAISDPSKLGQTINSKGTDPTSRYQQDLLKYQQEKKSGQLSTAQDIKAQQNLAVEKVKSNYSQDVIDFYNLSNAQKNQMFKQDPGKAQDLYNQAQDLAGKLAAAGLSSKTVSTSSGSKGRSGGRKSGGSKVARSSGGKKSSVNYTKLLASTQSSGAKDFTALRKLVGGSKQAKTSTSGSVKMKKVAVRKIKINKALA